MGNAPKPSRRDAWVMTPTPKQAAARLFMRNGCFPAGTDPADGKRLHPCKTQGTTTPFTRLKAAKPPRGDDAVIPGSVRERA